MEFNLLRVNSQSLVLDVGHFLACFEIQLSLKYCNFQQRAEGTDIFSVLYRSLPLKAVPQGVIITSAHICNV